MEKGGGRKGYLPLLVRRPPRLHLTFLLAFLLRLLRPSFLLRVTSGSVKLIIYFPPLSPPPPRLRESESLARFHGLFCVARGMDPGKIARVTPPVVRKEKKVNGKVGYFRRRATLILYMRKEEKRRSRGLIVDCLARELFGYYYYPFLSRLDRFLFFASIVQRFPSDSVAARPVLSGRARTIIRGG